MALPSLYPTNLRRAMLDSPAVVIVAMLVAPLMSAILALGLAVVQGDVKLLGAYEK